MRYQLHLWMWGAEYQGVRICLCCVCSQEESRRTRAQREGVVKMLVPPTQGAGALDTPNNEGRTVLMYAAMHGLSSVVEELVAAGAKCKTNNFLAQPTQNRGQNARQVGANSQRKRVINPEPSKMDLTLQRAAADLAMKDLLEEKVPSLRTNKNL